MRKTSEDRWGEKSPRSNNKLLNVMLLFFLKDFGPGGTRLSKSETFHFKDISFYSVCRGNLPRAQKTSFWARHHPNLKIRFYDFLIPHFASRLDSLSLWVSVHIFDFFTMRTRPLVSVFSEVLMLVSVSVGGITPKSAGLAESCKIYSSNHCPGGKR